MVCTSKKALLFNAELTHKRSKTIVFINYLKKKNNQQKIIKDRLRGGVGTKMKSYKFIDYLDPIILLCSEKYEFEAFGYNYVEHYITDNKKILENTHNGKCLEFSSRASIVYRQCYARAILFEKIEELVVAYGDRGIMYFNPELTKRKSKLIATVQYITYKIIKGEIKQLAMFKYRLQMNRIKEMKEWQ